MKKQRIKVILIFSALLALFMFGMLIGSFDFTRSKRLGKTNYYLVEDTNIANLWGLYYQYPDKESFVGVLNVYTPEVYWNEQYILATSCNIENDSVEGYYIVKMLPSVNKGVPWEKSGLLCKEEYEHQKIILHLREKEMNYINIIDKELV